MTGIVAPTYSLLHGTADVAPALGTVFEAPIFVHMLSAPLLGDPIAFDAAGASHVVPVPLPRLPGLDEIEVSSARFLIASAPREQVRSVSPGTTSAGQASLAGLAPGQTAMLSGVTLRGLGLTATGDVALALQGWSGNVVHWRRDEDGEQLTGTGTPGGIVQHLHVAIRPGAGGQAGPPIAAAPHFPMPGKGTSLYGPALAGARLDVVRRTDGRIDATLTMTPPQPMTGCTVIVGTTAEAGQPAGPHQGLPTDLNPLQWSAETLEARFEVSPAGVTVTAHAGATAPEDGARVARYDTEPGRAAVEVDFTPAARSVLAQGYPTSQGDDLGLALRVAVDAPASLHLEPLAIGARYVRRPDPAPAALQLRGAPLTTALPVPPGLRPRGLGFRLDGRFGPARLIAAADTTLPRTRTGRRVAGAVRIARRMILNEGERTLPLSRLGLFGRAGAPAEILVTRHGGDARRLGAALAPPVSLHVDPSPQPAWHRAAIAPRDGLPPHGPVLWLVVQATRGEFWWHADPGSDVPPEDWCRVSTDGGTAWTAVPDLPQTQLWVDEVDRATGQPAPLPPLALGWPDGMLNADLLGARSGPADFSRRWIAEGSGHTAFLEAIAAIDGPLRLSFFCRRDVALTLSDAALTYDPWSAGGGG